MSKRTTTSRSSPPSPHRFYKKQKTTDSSLISSSPPNTDMIIDPSSLGTSPNAAGLHSHMSGRTAHANAKENATSNGENSFKRRSRSPKVKPKQASPTPERNGSGDTAAGGWTKVEKKKEKRAKKGSVKASNQPPSFAFNVQELVKLGTISISVSFGEFLSRRSREMYN